MNTVTITVTQAHIDKALKTCKRSDSFRQQNCALAEAINAKLLPGMHSEVGLSTVTLYAPSEMVPFYQRVCAIDLPFKATAMIEAFDNYLSDPYIAPKPQPGSFVLDMSIEEEEDTQEEYAGAWEP